MTGLAFDRGNGILYGFGFGQLFTIDTATSAATFIGNTGFTGVAGLAFDHRTKPLYGADNTTRQIIKIDTATGAGTAVGPAGVPVQGLAFQ